MKRVNVRIKAVGGTVAVALALGALAGCGPSSKPLGAATTPPANSGIGAASTAPAAGGTTQPTAASTTAPVAAASPVLADGRSAAYLTGLDTTHNTVTFDLIDFLTGDAAKAEWKKEHPDNPDGPDDDYMIVNNNTKLRTLPVAASASCLVLKDLGGGDTKAITFAALPAFLKQQNTGMNLPAGRIAGSPFWLTVQNGTVTKFEEQFLP